MLHKERPITTSLSTRFIRASRAMSARYKGIKKKTVIIKRCASQQPIGGWRYVSKYMLLVGGVHHDVGQNGNSLVRAVLNALCVMVSYMQYPEPWWQKKHHPWTQKRNGMMKR